VAAICDNDTVVIDGAHGASIRWKSFYYVAATTNLSWKGWFATLLMEYQFAILVTAVALFGVRIIAGGFLLLLLWMYLWL